MAFLLLALFIGVPVLEIALFIEIGERIGVASTLLLIIVTAVLGTIMLRWQGLTTLAKAQKHLHAGEMPVEDVFTGVFLLVAGALLLTPGFFTDALGFALFVPAVRRRIGKAVFRHLMARGSVHMHASGFRGPRRGPGDVIDGEFEDVSGPQDRTGPDRDRPGGGGPRDSGTGGGSGWTRLP